MNINIPFFHQQKQQSMGVLLLIHFISSRISKILSQKKMIDLQTCFLDCQRCAGYIIKNEWHFKHWMLTKEQERLLILQKKATCEFHKKHFGSEVQEHIIINDLISQRSFKNFLCVVFLLPQEKMENFPKMLSSPHEWYYKNALKNYKCRLSCP